VKHLEHLRFTEAIGAFSILERIDVGETDRAGRMQPWPSAFSILERIDVGETRRSVR